MPLSNSHSKPVHSEAYPSVAGKLKAQEFMNDPQFKRLPRLVAACARAGWFQGKVAKEELRRVAQEYQKADGCQGSVFFLITGGVASLSPTPAMSCRVVVLTPPA